MALTASTESVHSIALADTLDIGGIESLRAQLAQALATPAATLSIDARAVERVDAAALQLLAAFQRAAGKAGMRVQWCEPSVALLRAVRWTGLGEWFGLQNQVAQATGA